MSVKLSGSLNYFPLIEILDLLVSEKETGNLSIELKDEKGGVFLEKGKIVHAYYKNLFQGKEAFFKLFTIEEGNFYLRKEKIKERTIELDTKELLDELAEKISNWDEIKKIVPSEDMYFRLIPVPLEFKQNKILLSREQWLLLTRLDGSRSVLEIAEELNMDLMDIAEMVANFFKTGFVQPLDIFETKEVKKPEKRIEASVFSGSLKSFSLLRILEFMNILGLSGKLKLLRGIYQGEVFIKNGELLHASNNIWEGELALVDLLSWGKGRFTFIPMLPDLLRKTLTVTAEEIILTCGENLNTWRKIQSVMTSPELIFIAKISEQEKDDEEELTFSRKQWRVLYNIDGYTSIKKLAENLKLSCGEVAECIYSLYRDGLVEPTELSDFDIEREFPKNKEEVVQKEEKVPEPEIASKKAPEDKPLQNVSEDNKLPEETSAEGNELTEETSAEDNGLTEETSAEGNELTEETSAEGNELTEETSAEGNELTEETSAEGNELTEETSAEDNYINKDIKVVKEKFDDLISTMGPSEIKKEEKPEGSTFLDR